MSDPLPPSLTCANDPFMVFKSKGARLSLRMRCLEMCMRGESLSMPGCLYNNTNGLDLEVANTWGNGTARRSGYRCFAGGEMVTYLIIPAGLRLEEQQYIM